VQKAWATWLFWSAFSQISVEKDFFGRRLEKRRVKKTFSVVVSPNRGQKTLFGSQFGKTTT
jgi:hypothetical protein